MFLRISEPSRHHAPALLSATFVTEKELQLVVHSSDAVAVSAPTRLGISMGSFFIGAQANTLVSPNSKRAKQVYDVARSALELSVFHTEPEPISPYLFLESDLAITALTCIRQYVNTLPHLPEPDRELARDILHQVDAMGI